MFKLGADIITSRAQKSISIWFSYSVFLAISSNLISSITKDSHLSVRSNKKKQFQFHFFFLSLSLFQFGTRFRQNFFWPNLALTNYNNEFVKHFRQSKVCVCGTKQS